MYTSQEVKNAPRSESMKHALITGITGQDGSYLAELLLAKGYEVHGLIRRSSSFNTGRIDHIYDKLHLHYGDLTDGGSLRRVLELSGPDEIYNLAAQSHVKVSFDQPEYTVDSIVLGTLRLLEAVRSWDPRTRIYQASSSEMFGNEPAPQSERTKFSPVSPYGLAKAAAHHLCTTYREAYGMKISCGILFNHESPRRGETFVTRKIAKAAARIAARKQDKLVLGNLKARRDWGFAGDYVEAMWQMLQDGMDPDDFVIATGESHAVEEFASLAFAKVGLDASKYIEHDNRYERPNEIGDLCGNPLKAQLMLNWVPRTSFFDLVDMMVEAECNACT